MDGNPIRRRLAAGERLYGCWISTASAAVTELLGHAGYDFLVIDQEHGPGTIPDAVHMLRAAEAAGCPAIVRVPWNDPVYLKRILDAGARSVMVPMVETPAEAAAAAAACRYPPLGRRGYAAPAMRCSAYGFRPDYRARAHEELFLIAQIESAAAASQAQAIAAVEGIDMVLIGVNDLAGTIGRLEQLDHPEVRALVAAAEAGLRAAGKPMGTVPSAARTAAQLFAEGYALVAGAGDVPLLREAAKADLTAARGGGGSAGPY